MGKRSKLYIDEVINVLFRFAVGFGMAILVAFSWWNKGYIDPESFARADTLKTILSASFICGIAAVVLGWKLRIRKPSSEESNGC